MGNTIKTFDVPQIVSDSVWDCVVTGAGTYALVAGSSIPNPGQFSVSMAMAGAFQPMLEQTLCGVFKKRVNFLNPVVATVICNGASLLAVAYHPRVSLTADALFGAKAAIYMLAVTKGMTKKVFNTSIYPSLLPVAKKAGEVMASIFTSTYQKGLSLFGKKEKEKWV